MFDLAILHATARCQSVILLRGVQREAEGQGLRFHRESSGVVSDRAPERPSARPLSGAPLPDFSPTWPWRSVALRDPV
jgi:hypothetical protein